MKLWNKSAQLNEKVEQFTIGRDQEFDLQLARFDIEASMAHTYMLHTLGIISAEEWLALKPELLRLHEKAIREELVIHPQVEDIHSQVELELTQALGELGKKIHTGRSRNDQVLVDLKLFYRDEIQQILERIQELFDLLQSHSEQYKQVLIPGYTHTQLAMVSSFGLWFGAFAEALVDDVGLFRHAFEVANQNPLGSAAGYGSSFPLDRQLTTDLLGFARPDYNVVKAQMGRGKTELTLSYALAGLATTLNKLASDAILYCNQQYDLMAFSRAFTTGSSIMPHKKNPDVMELIRGRTAQLMQLPAQVTTAMANLTSGYHRDFQLLKEYLFPALAQTKTVLELCTLSLADVTIKAPDLKEEKYKYLFSTEVVNKLVQEGMSFREAYFTISAQIESGIYEPSYDIRHTHIGSLGNLCTAQIQNRMRALIGSFPFEAIAQKRAALWAL